MKTSKKTEKMKCILVVVLSLATLVLLVLKLSNVCSYSWWYVLVPFCVPVLLVGCLFSLGLLVVIYYWLFSFLIEGEGSSLEEQIRKIKKEGE